MYIDRNEAIKRIRAALKAKTGTTWSVTGGRGTAWGWITVQAPPKRRVIHDQNPEWKSWDLGCREPAYFEREPKDGEEGWYTSDAECAVLGEAFGLHRPAHCQGVSISPDSREYYVLTVEG